MVTQVVQPSIQQRLAEPFPADEIKQRPGRGGMTFSYVDAATVMNRLDDVVGMLNWQTTFKVIDLGGYVVECTLSVRIDGEWITKTDAGYPNSDNDDEPLKSAYSDALKRAAVQFGIGRHLREKAPAKREATPASPTTQKLFDSAELLRQMAENNLTGTDLIAVTGKKADGKGDPDKWFKQHPGQTVENLVTAMKNAKALGVAFEEAKVTA